MGTKHLKLSSVCVCIYMRGFSITQQIAITYSIVAVVSNPPTLPPKTL